MKRLWQITLSLLIAVGISSGAVYERMSVPTLARNSNSIVVAQVTGVQTFADQKDVWRVVTLSPQQTLKGTPVTLRLKLPGGERIVNGRRVVTEYEGLPSIQALDRAVFFLEGRAPEYMQLTGFHQGLWKIASDSGKDVVRNAAGEAVPLNQFLRQIHQALKGEQR